MKNPFKGFFKKKPILEMHVKVLPEPKKEFYTDGSLKVLVKNGIKRTF